MRSGRLVIGWLLLVAVVGALAADLSQPPGERPSTHATIAGIHLYQATLAKAYAQAGVQCRFSPTCSQYAEAAVRSAGVWQGGWLAARRVIRCGPWTPVGTVDPVPHAARTSAAPPR